MSGTKNHECHDCQLDKPSEFSEEASRQLNGRFTEGLYILVAFMIVDFAGLDTVYESIYYIIVISC